MSVNIKVAKVRLGLIEGGGLFCFASVRMGLNKGWGGDCIEEIRYLTILFSYFENIVHESINISN